MYKALPFLVIGLITLIVPTSVWAFKSTSTNYKLEGEFGIFGGAKSSTNYKLTDTGGGFAPGRTTSTNYTTGSGFQYVLAEIPQITFTISESSVNLLTLSTSAVNTDSHTISVTTNAREGYTARVFEDGNLRDGAKDINDAGVDNDVDQSSEEYGLATSRSGQDITEWDGACDGSNPEAAEAITGTPQSVASSALPVDNHSTTLCYAASIAGSTPNGVYQHVLTYIATGTF